MTGSPGLRERKRARTRQAIIDAALRLFDERGFEHTTIADIAAAADIAPRTFFGYFASKEDVVFYDFEGFLDALAAQLAERPPGVTAIDTLHAFVNQVLDDHDFADENERCRARLIDAEPALAARDRALLGRVEEILTPEVARDLDRPADDLLPRMVAAAATATLARLDQADKKGADIDLGDARRRIDEAFSFLRGGLTELRG